MSGGYRWMDAYLFAWVVELGTDSFCETFLDYKNDPQGKTSGQMNHAARSGNRNFAEGCERLMTSTASGLDLLNVAKASLCELRDDYIKWLLSARQLPWDDTAPEAVAIRRLDLDPPPGRAAGTAGTAGTAGEAGTATTGSPRSPGSSGSTRTPPFSNRRFAEHLLAQYAKFAPLLDSPDSFVRANALLILSTRTAKMQEAYIRSVGEVFKAEGGFKERLGEVRRKERARAGNEVAPEDAPRCPECGAAMRISRRKHDNAPFWSCTEYPGCRGTLPYCGAHPR